MANAIKIGTTAIKAVSLFFLMSLASACTDKKNNAPSEAATTQTAATTEKSPESVTITGIVKAITFGKDGYTADVQTEKEGNYAALVSIVNVGGPDNHKSCEVSDKVTFKGIPSVMGDVKQLMVKEIINITPTQTKLTISSNSFRGIQVGDAIAKHGDYTKKTTSKTGEGDFVVYQIKDFDNNPAGYFMPDPNNERLVGDITVESPKASTEKGIKVGDTFKDLLKAYPTIKVHGSEVESRTYAVVGTISYRLDVPNTKQNVDNAKVPATTKITEIVINRVAGK